MSEGTVSGELATIGGANFKVMNDDMRHHKSATEQATADDAICNIPSTIPGCIILLNGFPGVGKYAIGQLLHELLGPSGSRFIDNHVLIDPVQANHPGRGSEHKALRKVVREVASAALKELPDHDTVIIMTTCLSTSNEDREVFHEHSAIALKRRVTMFFINIICAEDEHLARFGSVERELGKKTTLRDRQVLDQLLREHQLLRPEKKQVGM